MGMLGKRARRSERVYTPADLALRLGQVRRAVGMSVHGLARRSHIPRSTLHTYLTGRSIPGPEQLDTIADSDWRAVGGVAAVVPDRATRG